MTSLPELPEAIWTIILGYLEPHDLQSLILVSQLTKSQVQRHLYHELTLTEWASSGARLALAIDRGIVSEETCECVEVLRLQFTSIDEITEALRLSIQIQPRMPNICTLYVEGHNTEDALVVLGVLLQKYRHCNIIGVVARSPSEAPLPIARSTLPVVTSLSVPRLFRQEAALLTNISDLEVDEVVEDGSNAVVPSSSGHILDRLSTWYTSYTRLGKPPSLHLELQLTTSETEVSVSDPACTVLKLVATNDLPHITPSLMTPSLRVLILCNIAPLPTIRLLENSNLDTVEFISVAPVTLPALQALASRVYLPSLRLLLVLVSRASFLSDNQFIRKRETRRIVEWLQMLAAQYPVDVRDFSGMLRQDIYFSDGLWCLAAQTRYRKYLPIVAPPPLKSSQSS